MEFSYGNNIVFTISSILQNNNVEKNFFQFLTDQGIPNTVVTNGIYQKEENALYPKINTLLLEEVMDKIKEKKETKEKISLREKLKKKFHF